jgi:hypothetical protein
LKIFPYKISVVHKLSDNEKERKLQFTAWTEGTDKILFNTHYLDKACFHLGGTVSKQNMRFWGTELPENFHKKAVMEQMSPFGLPCPATA